MAAIIRLQDHPSNNDPTATLTNTAPGPGVYRVRAGFIAALRDGFCLAGHYPSEAAARTAQAAQECGQ